MSKLIYLDYAAATPVDRRVLDAMKPFYADKFYNPSANYPGAQDVKKAIDEARSSVAHYLGARGSEIVFTAGGTEANNLAVRGVMEAFPGTEVITSAVEHDSVLGPAAIYNHKLAPVLADGILDVDTLANMISNKTVLVSIIYANNEVGTVQPIKQVAAELTKLRRARQKKGNKLPLYLHTDAAQAANYLDLHASRLGADLITINGGKIYGPKQSGVLFVKSGVILKPQILGGGQERGLRSGTENVAAIVGLATALKFAQDQRQREAHRLSKLQDLFFKLLKDTIPSVIVNGSLRRRLPNNVHLSVPGHDNERLLIQLDQKSIYAAAGSACSASSDEPSHVLTAMGISDELAQSSLRFSMGRGTTENDVRKVVTVLSQLVA